MNEDSHFVLLEKHELTNSYQDDVKELNCHHVINDRIIARWYENSIICYISTNWLLTLLVPMERAVIPICKISLLVDS